MSLFQASSRKPLRICLVKPILLLLVACAAFLSPGPAAAEKVKDTRFKYRRGFYSAPFLQLVRSKTPGAKVRYTTDGSAPSETHGLGDSNPVAVRIETTTTLRAIAYKEGLEPTNVDTHTYIFIADVLKQPHEIEGYPIIDIEERAGWVQMDYGMDPAIVNHPAYRDEIAPALKSIPTISIVTDKEHLFRQVMTPDGRRHDYEKSGVYFGRPGVGTTRPASVELIYPGQPGRGFQIDCALQPHGTYSAKRALRLKFQKEYGPGKLESSIFRDAPLNGDSAITEFDRIVLRSGNTRSWAKQDPAHVTFTRDQWFRDSQIAMSGVGSHGTFVHLYLNGLYWGLYNAVERPDASFTSGHLGGERGDWHAVSHHGTLSGDSRRWDYLRGELKNKDMRDPENYRELTEYLDVTQFSDYLILAWYGRLDDWAPDRNWYAGHRTQPPEPALFFMWDTEYSWNAGPEPSALIHKFFLPDAFSKSPGMIGIWHSLTRNRDFMTLFADRVNKHCFHGGALTDESSIARWRRLVDVIDSAVIAESARWGDTLAPVGQPTQTRDRSFRVEIERVIRMMTGNAEHFINVLRQAGYYPTSDPPEIDGAEGGDAQPRVVNPNRAGVIYYTLEGTDPRSPGGAVAPSALTVVDGGAIEAEAGQVLKARIRTSAPTTSGARFMKPP